ncbi:MAG TPA: glycerophosphodiester phosphodiesterase family protein [Parvibaculum sp.]|uniref:glycerophosphodiester phosphodiesterase family protein n=1 Tax=Parvibaculum sp. TaxID=2024848 RepID=UPI002BE346B4|nr:glycerophosphodiester phosphodiesterase family protein [Parvibaculum sp.]HMM14692.1 glycerophosphodiester phosphodiesterase family protein [Parvibaculum sp.]
MTKTCEIAHRGGAGLWPENTLEAFERAIEGGADGIELDVHLSRDGVLVVHHDESLKPSIARGPGGKWVERPTPLIKELSFAELQTYDIGRLRPGSGYGARYPEQTPIDGARIPRLEDVYALAKRSAKPGFILYVELKTALLDLSRSAAPEALAEAAVALARRMGMTEQTVFVSFDWRALAQAKKIAPEIRNAFTTLPFFQIDPADPSATRDAPGSEDFELRAASASGAPWAAGFDWRDQAGTDFAERMLRAIAAGPADGWFSWFGDVTAKTAPLARSLGLTVSCWTVDEPTEMRRLAALGVDAILTDRPDRLRAVLAA